MICEYCETEHPEDQIANPHFCIARLMEKRDAIEEQRDRLKAELSAAREEIGRLRDEMDKAVCVFIEYRQQVRDGINMLNGKLDSAVAKQQDSLKEPT